MAVNAAKDKDGNIIPDLWIIDYRPDGWKGKRLRQKFHGTQTEARMIEMDLRRANRGAGPTSINPRLSEVFPDWLDTYANDHAENTVRDVKHCLVHLIPFFGNMIFPAITPQTIEAYKRQRLETEILPKNKRPEDLDPNREKRYISKRTINKELSYFSAFCKWAAENNYCESLPFQIKKFPAKQTKAKKPKIPHIDEIQALIDAIEDKYRLILLLLYDGGLRRSEALSLKGEDVLLKQRLIHITGKGDKERIVPITTPRLLHELQEAVKKTPRGYLSVNPKTKRPYYSIRKAILRAAKKAGIQQRVYHHLMRHSFGTHATAAGIGLRSVQEMMGHASSQTTELYTHLAAETLTREAEKFASFTENGEKPESSQDGEIDDK